MKVTLNDLCTNALRLIEHEGECGYLINVTRTGLLCESCPISVDESLDSGRCGIPIHERVSAAKTFLASVDPEKYFDILL